MNAEPCLRSQLARCACALLLLVCCGSASAASTSSAKDAKRDSVLTITEADNGRDIDLAGGQTLQVKLKSIAGTGYAWTLSGDPAPLKLTKSSTQRSKKTPGAPQMSVFQLSANSPGLSTLTFVYRRSWEYNMPPAKTFSVRVNVR